MLYDKDENEGITLDWTSAMSALDIDGTPKASDQWTIIRLLLETVNVLMNERWHAQQAQREQDDDARTYEKLFAEE